MISHISGRTSLVRQNRNIRHLKTKLKIRREIKTIDRSKRKHTQNHHWKKDII